MKEHDIVVTTDRVRDQHKKFIPANTIGTIIHVDRNRVLTQQWFQVEFAGPEGPRISSVPANRLRPEHTCVYCGCTDSKACAGGCAWGVTFQFGNAGVCTNCLAPHQPLAALKQS